MYSNVVRLVGGVSPNLNSSFILLNLEIKVKNKTMSSPGYYLYCIFYSKN